jgi:acetylornithine deacetylase
MKEVTELLSQLIKTPSISGSEDKTAALLADFLFKKTGIPAERIGNNIIAHKEPHRTAGQPSCFGSHHDTVKPSAG